MARYLNCHFLVYGASSFSVKDLCLTQYFSMGFYKPFILNQCMVHSNLKASDDQTLQCRHSNDYHSGRTEQSSVYGLLGLPHFPFFSTNDWTNQSVNRLLLLLSVSMMNCVGLCMGFTACSPLYVSVNGCVDGFQRRKAQRFTPCPSFTIASF